MDTPGMALVCQAERVTGGGRLKQGKFTGETPQGGLSD